MVWVTFSPVSLDAPRAQIAYKWNGIKKECVGVWECRLDCASESGEEGEGGEEVGGEGRGTSDWKTY